MGGKGRAGNRGLGNMTALALAEKYEAAWAQKGMEGPGSSGAGVMWAWNMVHGRFGEMCFPSFLFDGGLGATRIHLFFRRFLILLCISLGNFIHRRRFSPGLHRC